MEKEQEIMTLAEITKALDVAVAAAREKKSVVDAANKAVDDAKKVVAEAELIFNAAMAEARSWHQKYNEFMTSVLTNFGTLHK